MIPVPVPEADMVVSLPETLFEEILPDIPEGEEVIMVVTAVNTTGDGPGSSGMGKKPQPGESGETIEVASAAVIDLALLSSESLNVTDLADPIVFSLPTNYSKGMTCAFWDDKLQEWSTEGVEISPQNVPGNDIECVTFHLSLFAAIFRGFVNAIGCSQFRLLTEERIGEVIRSTWYTSLCGGVWLSTWIAAGVLFMVAAITDRQRARSHPWRDEYFVITDIAEEQADDAADTAIVDRDGSEDNEPQGGHKSILLPVLIGLAMACFMMFRVLRAFAGALRDVVDDLMSKYFEYFGEVRSMVEGVLSEVMVEAMRNFSMAKAVHAAMSHLVHSTAVKLTSARMNYNEDLMECLLQDELMSHITTALRQRGSEDAATCRYQLQAEGQKEGWDCLYSEVPMHLDRHVTRTSWLQPRLIMDLIVSSSPIGTIFRSNIFMSCKQKVFFLLLEFNGALLLSVAFFSASGAVKGKVVSETTCDVDRGAFAEVGRLAALALGSVLLSWLPTALLQSLQARRLVVLKASKKQNVLRAWKVQDAAVLALGCGYLAFAAFFVAVFLANLDDEDGLSMSTSMLLTLGQDQLVMPLALGALVPLMTHASVRAVGMRGDDHARAMRRSFHLRAPSLVVDI